MSAGHGIGDLYPMWETEPRESCFWVGCSTLALPISYVDGVWLRLCNLHKPGRSRGLEEGLAIERRWEGDVHPSVWVAPRRSST